MKTSNSGLQVLKSTNSTTETGHLNPTFDAVDESRVEACIEAKAIGQTIRAVRLKRSMGLVELGRQTGLSASFLSQIETGKVVPTVRNLARLALVLKKDIHYFLTQRNEPPFNLSRPKERILLSLGKKESPFLISDSLSALIPDRTLVPCIAEFLPTAHDSSFVPHLFKGQELVYIIEGSLTISTETNRQVLHPADTLWIDGNTKREYLCHGETPARAMIITFPDRGNG
jgi:transcriptional regulator with XRE-family HTH domain